MELKEFVRQVLVGVCQGVQQSIEQTRGIAKVSPSGQARNVWEVAFDVALVVEESSQGGGGLKVATPFLSLEGGKGSQSIASVVNRVHFVVPVQYPEAH